jgi:hypothetical protein
LHCHSAPNPYGRMRGMLKAVVHNETASPKGDRHSESPGKLDIREPDEIKVEKIASYYGVRVTEEPVTGMDGCIVRNGESGIITIRSTVTYPAQKRFSFLRRGIHVLT